MTRRFRLPLPVFELVGDDQLNALLEIANGVVEYIADKAPDDRRVPQVALALSRQSNLSPSEVLVGIQYGLRNRILQSDSSDGPLHAAQVTT